MSSHLTPSPSSSPPPSSKRVRELNTPERPLNKRTRSADKTDNVAPTPPTRSNMSSDDDDFFYDDEGDFQDDDFDQGEWSWCDAPGGQAWNLLTVCAVAVADTSQKWTRIPSPTFSML